MTRKRKAWAAALLPLGALAAIAWIVSSAGAHTPATFEFEKKLFENTTIVSRPDGTGTTAHHLISIPGLGTITCQNAEFEGTTGKLLNTTLSITKVAYNNGCKLTSNNESVGFGQGGCELTFTASGEMVIASAPGQNCVKSPMEFVTEGGCKVTIPEQTVAGLGFTNITTGGVKEVTMSMTLTETKGKRDAGCASPGEFTAGEYKTGNTVLGGKEDPGGGAVGMRWLATVP